MNWLGDSLDGTLARVRGIERPRYGYYLDHLVDAGATVLIGLGLGLSPHMLLSLGMLIVIAYLVVSINVNLESHALGRLSIAYGKLGPTEGRLCLIAINSWLALGGGLSFGVLGVGVSALDLFALAAALVMIAAVCARAVRNLLELARAEPAAGRRRAPRDGQSSLEAQILDGERASTWSEAGNEQRPGPSGQQELLTRPGAIVRGASDTTCASS